MTQQINVIDLIASRSRVLGWSEQEFIRRLGYANSSKAQRRIANLHAGDWVAVRGLLEKLPTVLGVSDDEVQAAVDQHRLELANAANTRARATFTPKAFILTDPDRPRQITLCGVTGGTRSREIDLTDIPETEYLPHAFRELHNTARMLKLRLFFDKPIGVRINYRFDLSKTFDLHANLLATHDYSREQGISTASIA